MSKLFISLDQKEQTMLERICLDKDPQEALEFIVEYIIPKVDKKKKGGMKHPDLD
ncbi:hypothetical protein [Acetohalobium arabaticum]|uniref:Uncharacterized protein n=1 Tax=Acetohalobium arabaticum (strain ATCC 49924 / DSM 5501 / Z-7288) TaxID=574087 RepID=D9QT19_ACEAZ|nr:hypothetical protein [Acetohalobium arabaticum]ADL13519.1 hypothetical protein Acear_2024 [Acetohalobium arabaticum DSM 5501]